MVAENSSVSEIVDAIPAEILILDLLHGDHADILRHAVAGDHGAGIFRGLLDIIRGSGRAGVEDELLRASSAGQSRDLVLKLLLRVEIMIPLVIDLHGIAERAGGPGYNRDLMNRSGILLKRRNESMPDLMVGDNELLLVRHDLVLLLIAGDHDLDGLLEIRLNDSLPSCPDRPERGLVDDIGKLRPGGDREGGPRCLRGGACQYHQRGRAPGGQGIFREND